jgi:hypothetical protein
MEYLSRGARMLALVLAVAVASCMYMPPVPDMSAAVQWSTPQAHGLRQVTVPFILDDNLVFVEISFLKPEGAERKVLAAVNMGQAPMYISNALFRELAPGKGHPLRFRIGEAEIDEDGSTVQPESMLQELIFDSSPPTPAEMAMRPGGRIENLFLPLKVEAIIPAGVLQHFEVVWDYGARTMTLAAPGSLKPEGIPVPIRVNPESGFVNLDVSFDGTEHPFVIDDGGSYSGFRDAKLWIAAHPERLRSIGGIGEANYSMGGDDAVLPVVKISKVAFGPLQLDELGGVEVLFPRLVGSLFWDWYSQKAGETTDGWIGGNVLKNFRVTIDCRNRMSYWLAEQKLDAHDLDQVGIVLQRVNGIVTVAGIARKNGVEMVRGVEKGDRLLKIGDLDTSTATHGQLLAALHGNPDDIRHLLLERKGKRIEVDVAVTTF